MGFALRRSRARGTDLRDLSSLITLDAVGNLHGWSDGDPFLVNYIGHPMEGAVAGFMFVHNDPRYRRAEFGLSETYWKSRLRATAWAWALSLMFEIGPMSEATIGHIQSLLSRPRVCGLCDYTGHGAGLDGG